MYDAGCRSELHALQRSQGELVIAFKQRDGATVLDRLRQDGCLKARFPRVDHAAWTTAVTLNTSGGVAGGDRLACNITAGEGTSVCVAGQAAERFYRSIPGGLAASVRTELMVAAGAALEWLPQDTILFDNVVLDRCLTVHLTPGGWFLGVECLVFGRAAMGERVQHGWLRDLIRVCRGGELILHDAIRLDGEIDALLTRPAIARGFQALATLLHVAPDAEAQLTGIRAVLDTVPAGVEAGASAWNGMLLARIIAPDSAALRQAVSAALATVRQGRPLPRVWMC